MNKQRKKKFHQIFSICREMSFYVEDEKVELNKFISHTELELKLTKISPILKPSFMVTRVGKWSFFFKYQFSNRLLLVLSTLPFMSFTHSTSISLPTNGSSRDRRKTFHYSKSLTCQQFYANFIYEKGKWMSIFILYENFLYVRKALTMWWSWWEVRWVI